MRRTLARHAALTLLLTCAISARAQDASSSASRVVSVTLHPGSAVVERVAQVAAGSKRLELIGLPIQFDAQSLRVYADPGIRVGEVSVLEQSATHSRSARVAELEARIEALGDQIAGLDVERQASQLQTDYLKHLSTPGEAGKPAAIDAQKLGAMLEGIRRGAADALARVQRVEVRKRALDKQMQALQRDLERLQAGSKDTRQVTINLSAERAGQVRIEYLVTQAGWRPTYRAALDSKTATLDLEREAVIAQSTGEDWTDVKLRLSTRRPTQAAQGGEPRTWNISLIDPRAMDSNQRSYLPASAPAALAEKSESLRKRDNAPLFEIAEAHNEFDTVYELAGSISLPADGRKVTVSLAHQKLPAQLAVQVAPRIETAAYWVAEAERPDGAWPAGPMQLVRDGSVVGSVAWNASAQERIRLPFGRDDLVQVKIETPKQTSGKSGFLETRNTRLLSSTYAISSRHAQSVRLLVLESTPVGTDEQIKVDASFEPKPGINDWDKRSGVVAWETNLPAKGKFSIGLNYKVTWPKERELRGLP